MIVSFKPKRQERICALPCGRAMLLTRILAARCIARKPLPVEALAA